MAYPTRVFVNGETGDNMDVWSPEEMKDALDYGVFEEDDAVAIYELLKVGRVQLTKEIV